jgi:hypothetical protein
MALATATSSQRLEGFHGSQAALLWHLRQVVQRSVDLLLWVLQILRDMQNTIRIQLSRVTEGSMSSDSLACRRRLRDAALNFSSGYSNSRRNCIIMCFRNAK